MKVTGAGFSEEDEKIDLLVSTPMKLAFKLTAGTSDVVNVETNLAELNTSDGTLGKAFDSRQVQNLPYLANNITYLLSLQPGVLALDSGAQGGGLNTDTRTGIVNGARQDQSNITLDGVDNNDQVFGYAFNGALRSTRDSVEEFRVTTNKRQCGCRTVFRRTGIVGDPQRNRTQSTEARMSTIATRPRLPITGLSSNRS